MKRSLRMSAASTLVVASMILPSLAFAADGSSSSAASRPPKKTVDASCMVTAVTARDTAISTALETVVTALQTRGTAMAAAWAITDIPSRETAIKAANTAFAGTWKTFNTARKSAWSDFKTAAKACHVTTTDAPSAASGSL